MDRIRHADLQQLLEHHEGPCVSMFIPMHLTGRDGMQDPVRLRKLADEAEEKLIEFGLPAAKRRNCWRRCAICRAISPGSSGVKFWHSLERQGFSESFKPLARWSQRSM
jgi:hypothetical protein